LLDDSRAGRARLYTGYAGTLSCMHASDLPGLLEQMQEALRAGRHAVTVFAYELGMELQGMHACAEQAAAQILLFESCEHLSEDQTLAWLNEQEHSRGRASAPAGVANFRANVDQAQFDDAIARIHAYLEAGDTYQVNYTYRLRFDAFGSLFALYRKLRAGQPAPYGAMIALPDGGAILSRSPELFVRNTGGELTAQPMKGTARADIEGEAARLAADPKNRAENLMIVDLLRNDLGRVAQLGSVKVSKLFDVECFRDVLQMTSTVRARVREDASLYDVLAALFPCGSITGAPKRRTMQLIRELETGARGIYTGAIGWFDTPQTGLRIGDFCLSVPIRTLVLQAPQDGVRKGEMGVGAGIVHDSVAREEYAECRLKAQFLTGLRHDFELIETMQASSSGCPYLEKHLQRLHASAAYFGFGWDEGYLRESVRKTCAQLPADGVHRMRLSLNQDGRCAIQTAPLSPMQEPVKLLLASRPTRSDELFLRHKTTARAAYDAAWRAAEVQGAFDMLFQNERGCVTEGARSNVFVKLNGHWFTPPLSDGLLPGVMRSVMLEDPAWNAAEKTIALQDLRAAEEIVVANALRGALKAEVAW
jgi:para-aminobenzoate synthetase/4-amino-4-deoxychorismate lyase